MILVRICVAILGRKLITYNLPLTFPLHGQEHADKFGQSREDEARSGRFLSLTWRTISNPIGFRQPTNYWHCRRRCRCSC